MSLAARPAAVALAAALPLAAAAQVEQGPPNVPEFEPAFAGQTRAPALEPEYALTTQEVAGGLTHPWGIAVLPGGGYLVTERSGALRHISADGTLSEPISGVPEVMARRQGGLLDVAVTSLFLEDRRVFLTYSKPVGSGESATAAATGLLSEDMTRLEQVTDIFVQEPASDSPMHFGSRVTINGDFVWITTGERSAEHLRPFAQDLDKTYGKVVRTTVTGEVPSDNPFTGNDGALPEIWSLGHRNIQGDAIRPSDNSYWTIEHGPKGGDELNRPEAGKNYGWPVISYGENYSGSPVGSGETAREGMEQPVYYWDPVIAPGDMVFYSGETFAEWEGDLLIASLTPGGIVRLRLEGDSVVGEERFLGELGRVRDIEVDSDGSLLVATDDPDGSLIRILPAGD